MTLDVCYCLHKAISISLSRFGDDRRRDFYGVRSGTKSIIRFRGLGNTSSLRKLFFETLSAVFVASVPCLQVIASLVSSYRFLRGIAGFSSWRRYGLLSSLRHFYVFESPYHVTLLPCYPVVLLPCYSVTPLPWYLVTQLPRYLVTLLSCYPVTLLPCYPVTMLPCYLVTLLPFYPVTPLPCYPITLLPTF